MYTKPDVFRTVHTHHGLLAAGASTAQTGSAKRQDNIDGGQCLDGCHLRTPSANDSNINYGLTWTGDHSTSPGAIIVFTPF